MYHHSEILLLLLLLQFLVSLVSLQLTSASFSGPTCVIIILKLSCFLGTQSSGSGSGSAIQTQKCTKSKSADDSNNNSNNRNDDASMGLNARDVSDNGSGTQV